MIGYSLLMTRVCRTTPIPVDGPREFSAVLVRDARRLRPKSRSRASSKHMPNSRGHRPGLGISLASMAILGFSAPIQSSSVAQFEAQEIQTLTTPVDEQATLSQAVWSESVNPTMKCRSGLDGSNSSFVEQVRARMADPANFDHIVTTFWPRGEGNYELTMMFWVHSNAAHAEVHEARATVDARTCQASVRSIG